MTTQPPYKKYEMESAMIKMIRQCNDNAIHWAYRLSQVPRGNKIIWDRLEIMSAEDIGMAYPWLRSYLKQQQQNFYSLDESKAQQVILLQTVGFFTRQYKSRLCDNIAHACFKDEIPTVEEKTPEDWVLQLKKAVANKDRKQAISYAANLYKIEAENRIIEALEFPKDPESEAIISYFKEQNSQQRNYHDLLFLINLVLYRSMDIAAIPVLFHPVPVDMEAVYADERILPVPDEAYCYHCTIGRNLGRGFGHYYEEAARLNQCFLPDPYEPLAKAINVKKDKG